jgi:hypothetical protein
MALGPLAGCGQNIFSKAADPDTDKANFYEAKRLLDAKKYDDAIAKIEALSVDYRAAYEVKRVYAGAYAGKCGLLFLSYFDALSHGSGNGATFFVFLMSAFKGKAVVPAACATAELIVKEIGATAAARGSDDNLFMAILAMAKIGAYMRNVADVDGTDALGDGTPDASFNGCDTNALSDENVAQIVVGFSLIIENISTISAALGGSNSAVTNINTLNDLCNAIAAGTGGDNPCLKFNVADVSALNIKAFRDLIVSKSAGVGTCNDNDPSTPTPILLCCP